MTLDKILKEIQNDNLSKRLLIVCSIAWALVAAGVMIIPFTLNSIMIEWDLSRAYTSSLASSTFLGMFIGAISAGYISDFFGRKSTSIIFLLLASFFSILNGISYSPEIFLFFRIIAGFGFGGLLPSLNTYLTEFLNISLRGKYLVYLETSWAFGSIFIALVHIIFGRNISWRLDYLSLGLGIIPAILLFKFPESPKYLILNKNFSKFEKLFNYKIKDKIIFENKNIFTFKNLFKDKYTKISLNIFLLWFTMSFGYYGIFIWIKDVLFSKGISMVNTDFFTLFMLIAQLPGFLLASYLIDIIGRRKSILFFTLGTSLSMIFFAYAFEEILVLLSGLLVSIFCLGAWGLTYAYTPELYPTAFRGTANGTASAVTRFAGFLAPFYTSIFIEINNIILGLLGISLLFIITGIFNYKYLPETKNMEIN